MIRRIIRILFTLRLFSGCLIFLSISASPVLSQTINNVSVYGNKNFTETDYLNWIGIGNGTKIFKGIKDSVKIKIERNLADEGYFHSKIDSIIIQQTADSQKVNLNINLNEGKPTFVKSIFITNIDSAEEKKLHDKFDFISGSIFNKFQIEAVISEILTDYENHSFPFSIFKIKSVYFYNDSTEGTHFADIYFSIEKGRPSRIDEIKIVGNTNTKADVIIRSARVDTGEVYSQKRIEEIPKNLNHLRFFEPVEQPTFYFDNSNKGILQIKVKEKQTNNFDGIIGYVPSNSNGENGYFTGFVNISLRNIFGTGRGAAFKWQKLDRNSQLLDIKYLEPWLFGYPFNIQLGLFQRKQDSTYIQRKFNAALDYLATQNLSAAIVFATESTIPTVNENSKFTVFNSSTITTGINLKFDSRDDFYAPTSGVVFQTRYSLSRKTINGTKEFVTTATNTKVTLQRLEADFSLFYELFRRNIVAISLFAKELRGDSFEISDLFRLGGANTLRGYTEDQFLGNRIFWSNLEYRVLMAKRTYAFLFFDTGYFFRAADPAIKVLETSAWKYGYGLGINLETSLGVLRVGYALGKDDSFNQGKIHFGLVNDF